jgi:hypothetical protein
VAAPWQAGLLVQVQGALPAACAWLLLLLLIVAVTAQKSHIILFLALQHAAAQAAGLEPPFAKAPLSGIYL